MTPAAAPFDLVIRGARVATEGTAEVGDIGIREGRIAAIGSGLIGERYLEAAGLLVLPGAIDAHVHVTPMVEPAPGDAVRPDGFGSATEAAAAGGITTIGTMAHQRVGEGLWPAIERELDAAAGSTLVDVFFHPVLNDPSPAAIADLAPLVAEGHTSLKLFLSFPGFEPCAEAFLDAMREAGRLGMLTLVHCEDGPLIRRLGAWSVADGRREARHYPSVHPVSSEVAAVARAVAYAEAAASPIYVVHLASAAALALCSDARTRGIPVNVETRPMYLHLTREIFGAPDGARYVGNPPAGSSHDREAMWRGLADGSIDTVCSDHAPWTLEQKLDPTRDVATFRPGVADLETMLPMLFSEGVHGGRISLQRFVEVTATGAARLFGLEPAKGRIAVGADADLCLWDPEARRRVDGAAMRSLAGYSVYDGWEVRGWPEMTVSRGEVVWGSGEVRGSAGRGQLVRRTPAGSGEGVKG